MSHHGKGYSKNIFLYQGRKIHEFLCYSEYFLAVLHKQIFSNFKFVLPTADKITFSLSIGSFLQIQEETETF